MSSSESSTASEPAGKWLRPMVARDSGEAHRAATPLELLYDLCFVVAIAQAAHGFHHAVTHGHAAEGILSYGLVFFAIWWAWMGFTWFASGFDNDDALYRIKVLIQMTGLLVLAAGVPRAFDHHDFRIITFGYVIMRIGLVSQWIRVARSVPEFRKTALRYAIGVTICQAGWLGLLAVPEGAWLGGFIFLVICEILVPVWAEKARGTPWHSEHIAERYGLMTIIVIGESVLAGTLAIQAAIDAGEPSAALVTTIASAPVILFAMWWIYFLVRPPLGDGSSVRSFLWGYLHYFVFASAAAVGAGLAIRVECATDHSSLPETGANLVLAVPVAIFLVSLAFLRAGRIERISLTLLIFAALVIAGAFVPFSPLCVAAAVALLTAIFVRWEC